MPFPIENQYIILMENNLKVKFPEKFKQRMMRNNGGELNNYTYEFDLYPFFDKKNRKRISRTCNHIEQETKSARKWLGFPDNAIAIGSDGCGNQLILIHDGNGILGEELLIWDHETNKIQQIAQNINILEK